MPGSPAAANSNANATSPIIPRMTGALRRDSAEVNRAAQAGFIAALLKGRRDPLAQIAGQLAKNVRLGHAVLDHVGWYLRDVGAHDGKGRGGLGAVYNDIAAIHRPVGTVAAEIA